MRALVEARRGLKWRASSFDDDGRWPIDSTNPSSTNPSSTNPSSTLKIDVLVAEIGSTTTAVNAFGGIHAGKPRFMGQGMAPTTVLQGDVETGLRRAMTQLAQSLNVKTLEYDEMLASSSAAGGLKMTVHGLVRDMTAKAAQEAALGAGAVLHQVTAGKLRSSDLKTIRTIQPNIILIAGGVDYGERDTALYNARQITGLALDVPVIYAGNVENQGEIKRLFQGTGYRLHLTENVYPKIDILNIEPARRIIQTVFESHIVNAPGMGQIRTLVDGPIMPTPGAVMAMAKLLYRALGDLLVLDVGGATTDVHSVTEGSETINRILINPEPVTKRTVEGDLGVYVNMDNVVNAIGRQTLCRELNGKLEELMANHRPIPMDSQAIRFTERLAREAVVRAVARHAGRLRHLYTLSGKRTVAEGKDLTQVRWVIGTGGVLTRLPGGETLLKAVFCCDATGTLLLPRATACIRLDRDYILASLGVLSKKYPQAAVHLAMRSLGWSC